MALLLFKVRCDIIEGGEYFEREVLLLEGEQIWNKYWQIKAGLMHVTRSGFGLYGIYPYDLETGSEIGPVVRSESDAEHSFGVAVLVMLVAMYCPEFIHPSEAVICLQVALLHEIGEIVVGDIPDDGRRDEAGKKERELQVVMQFVKDLPSPHDTSLMLAFLELQDRSPRLGRLLHGLDKLEAVLQGLIYEKEGHGGDILNKALQIQLSRQDHENMQRSASTRLVDIWAVHFLDIIQGTPEAPLLRRILRAAVLDVRGEWFSWAEPD